MALFDKLVVFVLFPLNWKVNYIGQIVHFIQYIKRSFYYLQKHHTKQKLVLKLLKVNSFPSLKMNLTFISILFETISHKINTI